MTDSGPLPVNPPININPPINNGFDISARLLAISARRDTLVGLIIQHQNELNDLSFEEQHLHFRQQQFAADVPDRRIQASQEYKAAYVKEILDL